MRNQLLTLASLSLVGLLTAHPACAAGYDPAYIDSPESKSIPDPARADMVAGSAQLSGYQEEYEEQQYAQQAQADAQKQVAAQVQQYTAIAQQAQQQQGSAGGLPGDPNVGPPIGGRSLIRDSNASLGYGQSPYDINNSQGSGGGQGQGAPGAYPGQQASPLRQIGGALLQDATNATNANLQRKIYGNDARVLVPLTTPNAPPSDQGW